MPDMEKQPFDFMGLRKIASVLSIVLVVASIALLGVRGLNLGMDFTGGTSVELEYAEAPSLDGIRNTLTEAGYVGEDVEHGGYYRVSEGLREAEARRVAEELATQTPEDSVAFLAHCEEKRLPGSACGVFDKHYWGAACAPLTTERVLAIETLGRKEGEAGPTDRRRLRRGRRAMGDPVSVVDPAIVHGRQSWTMAETTIPAAGASVPKR